MKSILSLQQLKRGKIENDPVVTYIMNSISGYHNYTGLYSIVKYLELSFVQSLVTVKLVTLVRGGAEP